MTARAAHGARGAPQSRRVAAAQTLKGTQHSRISAGLESTALCSNSHSTAERHESECAKKINRSVERERRKKSSNAVIEQLEAREGDESESLAGRLMRPLSPFPLKAQTTEGRRHVEYSVCVQLCTRVGTVEHRTGDKVNREADSGSREAVDCTRIFEHTN